MTRFVPLFITSAIAVVVVLLMMAMARAEDCPKGVKSCVVVTMTPEETQTLFGGGMIMDQALWANRSGMSGLVDAWKKKIETSPAGTIKTDEPAK